jgi:hypothetical protein
MKARQDSPNNFWKRVCKLKLKIATIKIISYLWQAINQKIEAKAKSWLLITSNMD